MRSQIIARIVKILDENYTKDMIEYDIITNFITKLIVDGKLSEIIHSEEK
jgi:hypothetical protein